MAFFVGWALCVPATHRGDTQREMDNTQQTQRGDTHRRDTYGEMDSTQTQGMEAQRGMECLDDAVDSVKRRNDVLGALCGKSNGTNDVWTDVNGN